MRSESGSDRKPAPHGGMIADLRLLPRPFWLLLAGSFINRFGHFVIPFLAIYLRQLGFEPAATGYALAAYGAGGFFASILGGYLSDRIGRKPTLLISCFGAAATMVLLAYAKTLPAFVAGGGGYVSRGGCLPANGKHAGAGSHGGCGAG